MGSTGASPVLPEPSKVCRRVNGSLPRSVRNIVPLARDVDFGAGEELNVSKFRSLEHMKVFAQLSLLAVLAAPVWAGDLSSASRNFLDKNCFECHDAETKKGGLDLTSLKFDLATTTNFSKW